MTGEATNTTTDPVPAPADPPQGDHERVTLEQTIRGRAPTSVVALLAYAIPNPDTVYLAGVPEDRSIGDLCDILREIADGVSVIKAAESAIKAGKAAVENALMAKMTAEGIEKASGVRMSVTLGEKSYVKYDPDKFEEIVSALAEHDMAHVLYRQFSATKLQALFDTGARVPDGLSLESKPNLTSRRKG